MKKALVIYNSQTGITKRFGEEIGDFLDKNNIDSRVVSIFEFDVNDLTDADYVLLGCWTSGLMIVLQHPERTWIEFSKTLPELKGKRVGLFTTYKIATGTMFNRMRKHIKCDPNDILIEIKSRDGHLTESIKSELKRFMN
jgi:flavodoxin